MNHLEAFMSEDAKRGRKWIDDAGHVFRRNDRVLRSKPVDTTTEYWVTMTVQVSDMPGEVHWADEPAKMTPREVMTPADALRALADGKCVATAEELDIFRLSGNAIELWCCGAWSTVARFEICAKELIDKAKELTATKHKLRKAGAK